MAHYSAVINITLPYMNEFLITKRMIELIRRNFEYHGLLFTSLANNFVMVKTFS